MVGDGCAVVVCDGDAAFLVVKVSDERSVEYERLRADFVAGHAFGEAGDFGGGEGGVPDADFCDSSESKQANRAVVKSPRNRQCVYRQCSNNIRYISCAASSVQICRARYFRCIDSASVMPSVRTISACSSGKTRRTADGVICPYWVTDHCPLC